MGNFLAIVAADSWEQQAEHVFRRGLGNARALNHRAPSRTTTSPWSYAATLPRQNGSGTPIVCDPATGSWLLATGTWFHAQGAAPGEEMKLLQRCLQVGPVQLAKELEGFFCILIGDARTKEVILITDIVGSCHAFFRALPHVTALSGSSLLLASLEPYTLDSTACQEFVCTGIIYQDRTLYRDVRKLPPATVFWFAEGALKHQQHYWSCSELQPETL